MQDRFVVGVDLGGTNVRACAYSLDGVPAGPKFDQPSNAQSGTDAIIQSIADVVRLAVSSCQSRPEAVGIAVPGHIDMRTGVVRWAPNFGEERDGVFYSWFDVPLGALLSPHIDIPIFLGNDANLAALGEYRFGSGKNSAKCLVLLTIGTGIGGGVVMTPDCVQGTASGPLLLLGANHGGAELGHTMIQYGGLDCNAGTYGPIESYCQRDSIVKRAVHRLQRGRPSIMREMIGGDLSKVTPKIIDSAADEGDELALEVWHEVGTYLGAGIGSLINVFAPDVFAIGGQIAKAGEHLLGPARRSAANVAVPSLWSDVNVVQAEQIDDAGMLGGAALAMMRLG
ncbi:MAG: ROK family protein [Fimbriimonadaceae bacterium]|nr:ROK family protein [Fimbriimonadaceae bacterium]